MEDQYCSSSLIKTINSVSKSSTPKIKHITLCKVENGYILEPDYGGNKVFLTLREAVYEIEKLFV